MSIFEFTAVLLSVVLGLGIAELMSGVLRVIRARPPFRTWWVSAVWGAWLLVTLVQTWWVSWGYSSYDLGSWSLWQVLVLITPSLLLYLAAGLVLPSESWASDPWRHYMQVRPFFFGVLLLLMIAWTVEWTCLAEGSLFGVGNLRRALTALLYVTLAATRRETVHRWGTIIHAVFVASVLTNLLGGDASGLGF